MATASVQPLGLKRGGQLARPLHDTGKVAAEASGMRGLLGTGHPSQRRRQSIDQASCLEPTEIYPGAGAGLSGAPLTETGPTRLGSRDVFLRHVLATRVRAFGCGMEEVVSGVTAFCRESTRVNSEES